MHRPRVLLIDPLASEQREFARIFNAAEAHHEHDYDRLLESMLGGETSSPQASAFARPESAHSAEAAWGMVRAAVDEADPYLIAFVNLDPCPTRDGVRTLRGLWEIQPELECVVYTTDPHVDWKEFRRYLGAARSFLIIRPPFEPDEVLQITRSLAEKSRLSRALRDQMSSLETRVLERTLALEEADRAKSRFLAAMSHEIRTPMSAVLGYTDMLLLDHPQGGAEDERRQWLETIRRNGEHLLGVINDILDLSLVESGKLQVEPIRVAPRQLIEEVQALLQVRAAEKHLSLSVQFDSLLPETILTDPTRLRQVLINLLGNAIKFTEHGGVTLRVSCPAPESVRPEMIFDVVDTGIGMSGEQLERLFQPFAQANATIARIYGGTGLGLAISRKIARRLGGDITVRSEVDRGSEFRLTIATGSLTGVRLLSAETPCVKDTHVATAIPTDFLAGLHVLLAEDGPDSQRLMQVLLRRAGAEVTAVDDGRRALDLILVAEEAQAPFDVLLTDIQLPEMSGLELAGEIRARGLQLPILAITAHAMNGDRERCLAAGCDDYLAKPVDKWTLIERVRAWSVAGAASG